MQITLARFMATIVITAVLAACVISLVSKFIIKVVPRFQIHATVELAE